MSSQTVDLKEIQEKLIDKLRDSGWADKLKTFLMSSEFTEVLDMLNSMKNEGKRFTPPLKHIFSAFEECPYKDLKVIIVGQDPYPQLGVADGRAFSCSITKELQPSLKYIFDAIEKTVHQEFPTYQDPDLTRWSKQGVLLLNTALTTEVGKIGIHYKVWQKFIVYVVDMLSWYNPGLIWVFMGKQAQELEALVSSNHYKFLVSHPASAAYQKASEWDCEDVFNKVNEIIEANNGREHTIKW
jgi:uracil-DNA glycosylase